MNKISYLDTILSGLKREMEQKMIPGKFYDFSPTIVRGITNWEDSNSKRPLIWFIATDLVYEETMSSKTKVEIFVELHGYTDTDGYDNSINMITLLKDLEYFLYNDYSKPVNLLNCVVDEGGIGNEIGQSGFMLNIKITTDFNITTIK